MNHAPLRILTGAAALVLSVSLLTSAAVPVRSLPAAFGEETVLARPSLQDPDTLARAVACQSLSYYRPELLDRYLAYGALWPELSPEDVVTRVNIGLDGTFYGDVSQAEEPESLSVLVNKYHPLPDGYVPRLHSLPARYAPSGGSLAPAAAAAFMRMADAIVPNVLLAQGIGRWGNFINQEAFGLLSRCLAGAARPSSSRSGTTPSGQRGRPSPGSMWPSPDAVSTRPAWPWTSIPPAAVPISRPPRPTAGS